MKLIQLQEDDLLKRRQQKQTAKDSKSVGDAVNTIEDMKNDFNIMINSTIDNLVNAGMTEDRATMVVMTHLSDLVMADDLSS